MKEMQWFLIKTFICILVVVGIAEYFILELLNRFVMPVVSVYFFPANGARVSLNGFQILAVLILLVAALILRGVQKLLPASVGSTLQWIGEGAERLAGSFVPAIGSGEGILEMDATRRTLLMLFLLAAVIILLLPVVVGAMIYARIVVREFAKLEQERQRAEREYDRQRNLMLSDIAHDLRTPITTVAGYATALADGVAEPERQQEYLNAIRNKSVRMNELITLLFDYVKLDSEGFSLDMESVELCELLRENAALIYSDMEDSGMELEIEIPETQIKVTADRLQVSRVVTNLLVNAMRHNPRGTRIGLYLIREEDCLKVAVADSGACIGEELAGQLFEPFSRGDKSRSGGGSGLGLSIAKKVVEMHGWTLALVQQPQIQRIPGIERYAKAFLITIPQKEENIK